MMAHYISEPAHFAINVHYLTSEHIDIGAENEAIGRWKMLQVSTFRAGGSHLNSAELVIRFKKAGERWLIDHFTTRNLWSRRWITGTRRWIYPYPTLRGPRNDSARSRYICPLKHHRDSGD